MIEWEPNKNDANLNIPVDGQVASICWNEQTKLLTMSLAYSAVYGMGERYNGLNQNDRIVKIEVEEKFCNQGDKSYCPSPFFFTDTGFSFCTLSGGTLIFDFTQKNVITVHAPGNCKFIFNAGTPEKLISEYMSLIGGRLISFRPQRGPEAISRRSLQILESFTAIVEGGRQGHGEDARRIHPGAPRGKRFHQQGL